MPIAIDSGTSGYYLFYELSLSLPEFEHPTYRMGGEYSHKLHGRCGKNSLVD